MLRRRQSPVAAVWHGGAGAFRNLTLLCCASLLVLTVSGCGSTDEQIEEAVRMSLQNTLDTVPQYMRWHLKVTHVRVLYQAGNLYQGTATVTCRGTAHSVPLLVTCDGDDVAWQTRSGAFDFASR